MTANEAIQIIHVAIRKCIDSGWRFKGKLEAVNPLNQQVSKTILEFEKGRISNQQGTTEIFNIIANLEKLMTKQTASMILEANDPTIQKVSNSGEVCKVCGGTEFRRMGTCLYCVNCGESTGCS